jgi:outer membrane protein TolC
VAIETEIRNAIEGFASARRSLALAQSTLELQRGRLEAESEKLKAGRSSTSQVSDAREGVRSAEREELSARLELVRKSFEFDQALGRSVESWSRPPDRVPD